MFLHSVPILHELRSVRQGSAGRARLRPNLCKGHSDALWQARNRQKPLEASYEQKFGPADVALAIQRNPDLKAVGVFTGIRGNGIVILDVDRNLSKYLHAWGSSLDGAPIITSTKANAAKYLFRVPEELWADVKGHGLRKEDGGDYEILWGRQGVVCGAYPGGKVSKPGEYIFEGDLNTFPRLQTGCWRR